MHQWITSSQSSCRRHDRTGIVQLKSIDHWLIQLYEYECSTFICVNRNNFREKVNFFINENQFWIAPALHWILLIYSSSAQFFLFFIQTMKLWLTIHFWQSWNNLIGHAWHTIEFPKECAMKIQTNDALTDSWLLAICHLANCGCDSLSLDLLLLQCTTRSTQ